MHHRFFSIMSGLALVLVAMAGRAAVAECPADGACCEPNGSPGCDDAGCCRAVCGADAFCCETEWDAICADLALDLCVACGACPGACDGDLDGNGLVDGADLGLLLGAWSEPGCSDLDEDGTTDGADLGLLLGGWGTCATCPGDGDCCEPNGSPGCDDAGCCEQVCAADAFCCETEWDALCAQATCALCTIDCCLCDPECNGACPGEGDCCVANGSPGCGNATCCLTVCSLDAFCCEIQWDSICVGIAAGIPACRCEAVDPCPGEGECCDSNGTPGCNDEACCEVVCAVDSFCCNEGWDSICGNLAIGLCELCAGCPGMGDCCIPNGTPACQDAACCEAVCSVDPFCCTTLWDEICADQAQQICPICR
jgi:hypothetical protein